VGSAFAACPNHWMRYSNNCYLFVTRYPMEWIDAMTFCKAYGAILAEPKTYYVNDFLRHEARRLRGYFWLGGSDIFIERTWMWMGSNTRIKFSAWGPGEPNNSGGSEHCMLVAENVNYLWNDGHCQSRLKFICEKPA
ncbi:perlucin-like, partial [Saccostrea cucullata]|uniref:perlucin-like n=1 Tax=Saccostrea cuccullata TaxID=36930 RepID=UPI002ED42776